MKQLKKDLQTVSKTLKALTLTVERMKKRIERIEKQSVAKPKTVRTKSAVAPKPIKKRKPQKTAYATFLGIVSINKKGVTVRQIQAKTGFDDKKIRNLVYKATKQGAIKSIGRGVYVKA